MQSCGARPSRWTTATLRTECAWHCPRILQLQTRLHQAYRSPHAWHQNVQCGVAARRPMRRELGAGKATFLRFRRVKRRGKSGPSSKTLKR
eukprot:7177415-Prymnesium_polylepis.3